MSKIYRDTLAGVPIKFTYLNRPSAKAHRLLDTFFDANSRLGIDTESTGLNCYRNGWQLRTVQIGNATEAIIIPAHIPELLDRLLDYRDNWITHNGPHDFRCIDRHLGYETGMEARRETHIIAHHIDSRNQQEGGTGHGLKDLAVALVDPTADRWEKALKAKFKEIRIPTGELYKSGKNAGQPKTRICTYAEGWGMVDPTIPEYIKYAGVDPILTYRVWDILKDEVYLPLYVRDYRLQQAVDRLHRRAMLIDVAYTTQLDTDFVTEAAKHIEMAREFGCDNINSTTQVAETLAALGARLTDTTPTGKYKVTDNVLRAMLPTASKPVQMFIHAVLTAKQLLKRHAAYTQNFLLERDENDRVHPSINILGARTARMSVSNPALQQLPTKDRSDDLAT